MSPRRVHVHIGALALRGFSPEQRDGIAGGLADTLRRQLADPAITSRLPTRPAQRSVSAPAFPIDTRTAPAAIGSRAGAAVARSVCKQAE